MESVANIAGFEVIGRETRNCEKHGQYLSKQNRINGNTMDWTGCPACKREADAALNEEWVRQRRAEAKQKRIDHLFAQAAIPKRFQAASFETYAVDNPGQARALRMCKQYAENFKQAMEKGQGLILAGLCGTGKTHLGISIARAVIAQDHSALFIGALDAIKRVRATWRPNSVETEAEVLAAFREVDLLVLDEIGAQFRTEAEQTQLFEIIQGRYLDMRPTVIISNLAVDQIEGVIGQAGLDRLREGGGKLVPFDWDSHRRRE